MFRRKMREYLKSWKETKAGKYALLIEGARRVGKSTTIEEFVRTEYRSHIIISFEKTGEEIKRLFRHMDDLNKFFLYLQQYTKTQLYERQSAIVFDEVQLFPLARQAIKALVEDGRFDYYETGSLISIKKNVKDILIPSEEHTVRMYPMDFEEFLWATDDEITMPIIKDAFDRMEPLDNDMHRNIMESYRTYMLVGGMPQAVQAFVEHNSFSAAEEAKEMILELYLKDSMKLDGNYSNNTSSLLQNLPSYLEKHDKEFSPGIIRKDSSVRDYRKSIKDLAESMMVNICYRITEPALDQGLHYDENDLKMYLCDTGLLFTHSFRSTKHDPDEIYNSVLHGELNVNQGMYFENMVAQEFRKSGHGLYFSKFTHQSSDKKQEIDFVITRDRRPTPIEVKSGQKSKSHKSLDRFIDKYGNQAGRAYVIHAKNLEFSDRITYLPIYMTGLL